jgi:ferredoxin
MQQRATPELLPGASEGEDCQNLIPGHEEEEHRHDFSWAETISAGEPAASLDHWRPRRAAWSRALERIALVVEKPVNQLMGNRELNPFYHTGQIALFLLMVVTGTGLYLFLFFQYGFDASYLAVERIEGQFIARTMRAIHRYASGALVITTLLHAGRTLFLEQFHGPRWLPWITGVVMTGMIWLAGVTGYWLLWDSRAQAMTERLLTVWEQLWGSGAEIRLYLLQADAADRSWPILLSILAIHVLLTMLIGLFFWLHLRRLSRPRWLPELHWIIGMGIVLLVGGILFPAGLLPQASFDQLAGRIEIDPLFLFYLPLPTGSASFVWGGLLLLGLLALALPWLPSKRPSPPTVRILHDRCTGCTKCALDCPYDAIQMVERHDGKPHKYIAIANRDLCISCGICVGSCDGLAVSLGSDPPELLWQTISLQMSLTRATAPHAPLRLVLTCDRHFDEIGRGGVGGSGRCVVALPCAGAAPPDLLTRALDAGATEVVIAGCPPNDCVNREGNLWTAQRLLRERVPRLKRAYEQAPITAVWVAPNEAPAALWPDTPAISHVDYANRRNLFQTITWRNLLVGFGLLALVLALQIGLTQWPLAVHAEDTAVAQILLADVGQPLGVNRERVAADEQYLLQLWIDGRLAHQKPFSGALLAYPRSYGHQLPLTPGNYQLTLRLVHENGRSSYTLLNQETVVAPRQIIHLSFAPRPIGFCANAVCAD